MWEFKMTIEVISKFINTVGLIFDIIGAWLVAWEVLRQFQGKKVDVYGGVARNDYFGYRKGDPPAIDGQQTEETKEYKKWETKKYLRMKIGLIILTFGFFLQIVSCWTVMGYDFFKSF